MREISYSSIRINEKNIKGLYALCNVCGDADFLRRV